MNFPIDRNQHKRAEDSIAAGVEVNLNGGAQSELFDTRFRKRSGSNLKDAGRNAAAATSRAGEALNSHVFKSNQWSYPSRKCPKGASIRILSQMIFVIASIGTAPHPIPEDQSNNDKEGIERETPRQQHRRYGFAFGKVN